MNAPLRAFLSPILHKLGRLASMAFICTLNSTTSGGVEFLPKTSPNGYLPPSGGLWSGREVCTHWSPQSLFWGHNAPDQAVAP
jgi:hypothetical protein